MKLSRKSNRLKSQLPSRRLNQPSNSKEWESQAYQQTTRLREAMIWASKSESNALLSKPRLTSKEMTTMITLWLKDRTMTML